MMARRIRSSVVTLRAREQNDRLTVGKPLTLIWQRFSDAIFTQSLDPLVASGLRTNLSVSTICGRRSRLKIDCCPDDQPRRFSARFPRMACSTNSSPNRLLNGVKPNKKR